jgi:hypothetical protein
VSIWNASSQKCCVQFEWNIWKIRFDLLLYWLLISRPKYGEAIFPFIKQNWYYRIIWDIRPTPDIRPFPSELAMGPTYYMIIVL